jgi:TetR/AcrR family transcriptional repressor of nem operon
MISIMRYQEGHKAAVRAKIVKVASKALRASGLAGVSIPALMKRVGLTHGGFYAHFEDRDALVAEAILAAAQQTGSTVFAEDKSLDQSLALYLSSEHVAQPAHGCVVAGLGADGVKHAPPVRSAFAAAARGLIAHVQAKLEPARDAERATDEALLRTATMVGAVVLARLLRDDALGERVLAVARDSTSAAR